MMTEDDGFSRPAGPGKPIDLVLFDCDGTLLESEALMNEVLVGCFHSIGLPCTLEELNERYSGVSYAAIIADLSQRYGVPILDGVELMAEKEFLSRIGKELVPTRGAQELLEAMPVRFCMASNAPRSRLIRMLRTTGLLGFFGPHIVSGRDVEAGKPDPAVFLLAAELMGVSPDACLVVEDSVTGLRAGRAAGMRVAAYLGASHQTAVTVADVVREQPDIVLNALTALLEFLPMRSQTQQ